MSLPTTAWPGVLAPDRVRLTNVHVRRGSPDLAGWRRNLTIGLGLLWLLDAALQFQPYMFTTDFPNQAIKPVGDGSPGFVAGPSHWAASLMAGHIGLWNSLFALTQLAIAVGLLFRRSRKAALAGSIVWALAVWWLGEGLGGVLAGPVSPLAGLPGAVIVYAVVAVLLWPRPLTPAAASVVDASPQRRTGVRLMWLALWLSFAFEALRPANRAPSALYAVAEQSQAGEPGWVKALARPAGVLAHHGTQVSIVLAIVFLGIAVSVFIPAWGRTGVAAAIAVSLLMWVFGEALGGLATGQATDPNTGPVLVLLALCFWRVRRSDPAARDAACQRSSE